MLIHTVFDLLAWLGAALFAWWISRTHLLNAYAAKRGLRDDPGYFLFLAVGALVGAWLSGSLNLSLAHIWTLGHSIAGAIAGGIVAVEVYKLVRGIKGSTGLVFVGPLALGIAIGRLGCFFAGLPDYTYGTPTSLPWGVDFGDGIRRHPVQLYESAAMWVFLAAYVSALCAASSPTVIAGERTCAREGDPGVGNDKALLRWFLANSFYVFVGWYALQRFLWEFLKPYPPVAGPFNIFHLICVALFGYSLIMLRRGHDVRQAV